MYTIEMSHIIKDFFALVSLLSFLRDGIRLFVMERLTQ